MKITPEDLEHSHQDNNSYHRYLIENCPTACILSRHGKVMYANQACLKMFGLEHTADISGISLFDYIAPACREDVIDKATRRSRGENIPNKYETFGLKTDGSILPLEVEVTLLNLPDGLASAAFVTDITEQENAKNILKETEARWHSITENSPDHITILDTDFNILFVNHTLDGLSKKQLIGSPILNHVSADYYETVNNCLKQVLKTGEPGKYEVIYQEIDHINIHFESRVSAIRNDNKTIALLINARNVTDKKTAELAKELSERKYRELVDETTSIILRWDTNGKITFFNEYAQKFFEFKENEILGKNVVGTIVPEKEFTGRDLRMLMKSIRQDPSQFEYNENENITRNGKRVWITWKNKPIFNDDNELIEILSVGIDGTERKKAEDQIRHSEKELKAILNSLQDTYYRVNQDGYVDRVSPSVEKLLGFTQQEALNIRLADLYVEADGREKFLQKLVENNGSISSYRTQLRHKDGSIVWVSTNAHFCLDDQGNITGVEGTSRNIDDLIRYEEALRQSEERFRAIFERSASGMALIDVHGHPVVTNQAVHHMFGYDESELKNKTFMDFSHSDDVEIIRKHQSNLLSGKQNQYNIETRCFRKNGDLLWISLKVSAIRDDNNQVNSFVGVLEDITERKNMEEALEQSTAKFKAIFNSMSDAIFYVDTNRRILLINPAVTRVFGYTFSELKNHSTELLYANREDFIKLGANRFNPEASPNQALFETTYVRKDGSVFSGESFGTKVLDDKGNFIGFIGIVRDITERKVIDDRLRLSQKIFEDAGKAILVTDAQAKIIDVNDAFCEITGYNKADLVGKIPQELQSERHDALFYKDMWDELNASGYWQGELWEKKKSGEEFPNWATISVVKDENGKPNNYVAVFSDITAIKATEEQLEQLAHYDQLTGLPNRMLFHNSLRSAVARAKRHNLRVAVMYIDLDGFKQVNDTLGHSAGDNLLKRIASRLKNCVRDEDTIARLGGDEFALIVNQTPSMTYLNNLAQRIVTELVTTLNYENREIKVSGSVGIATYPADGTTEENLLRNADQAMYQAKQKGKNNFQLFDPDMNSKMMKRIHLESDLRLALKNNELFVQFQPKYNLQKYKVVGVEALVRWQHPNHGVLMPQDFIPLAEDSELIIELGKQVLEIACRSAKIWYNAGRISMPVAINISTAQFKYDHFIEDIKSALIASGLPASLLEIEITESLLMDNIENTIHTLNELKKMGVSISIDDFGTGYSSLSYLKKLPVDTLKIDKSFVLDIAEDDDDRAIISAIISMAKSLNLYVIAEGVETEEQLGYLRSKLCHVIQGYLLAEPVSFDELEATIMSIERNHFYRNPEQ